MGATTDGARGRRRGQALEHAIHVAVLTELASAGYQGLTMEAVARRARTGKAALYRRWASKQDLVLDALLDVLPEPAQVELSGSVRDNLLTALRVMTDALAGEAASFDVMVGLLGEPELRRAFQTRIIQPRLRLIQTIIRKAGGASATPLIARVGPALVLQTFLLTGRPPARAELTRIVDHIIMPLLTARSRGLRSRPSSAR